MDVIQSVTGATSSTLKLIYMSYQQFYVYFLSHLGLVKLAILVQSGTEIILNLLKLVGAWNMK